MNKAVASLQYEKLQKQKKENKMCKYAIAKPHCHLIVGETMRPQRLAGV